MPFLRNVTRGRGVPDERLEEVAAHYHAVRWRLADQCAEPRADRRAREGVRRHTASPADLLRQPQLAPVRRRRRAAMRDDHVKRALVFATSATVVVLGLPAVPQRSRAGAHRRRRRRARAGQAAALLRPSRFHRRERRPRARRARDLARDVRAEARLVFTAHSIPLAMNDASGPRAQRSVPRAAPRDGAAGHRAGARCRRRVRPRVAVTLRSAAGAVARAGHQRPPDGARAAGRARGRGVPDRIRLRPPRGVVGSRHRGPRDGRVARACTSRARRRPACIPAS